MIKQFIITAFLIVISCLAVAHEVPRDTAQFNGYDANKHNHGDYSVPDSNWSYDHACCNNQDCAPIHDVKVKVTKQGYIIILNKGDHPELRVDSQYFIPHGDKVLRESQDQRYHACISLYDNSIMRCLYVPPGGT